MTRPKKRAGPREFVALMALLGALVALAIDAMLPALPDIAESLRLADPNDSYLIVTVLFFGLAAGQLLFGPYSDSFGRKPAIYLGIAIFMVGCLVSMMAPTFNMMLVGRALQGLGAASTRVVTIAIIRDLYVGREMAHIMSLIMMVFILVPALAPSLGQVILWFAPWQAIFGVLLVLGALCLPWFALRQEETLPPAKRAPFSLRHMLRASRETLSNRVAFGYMAASALIFSAFIGYISTAQRLFQDQYQLGERFPLYFSALALAIGAAGFANSKLVHRYGMQRLCTTALIGVCLFSASFYFYAVATAGHPPLAHLLAYLLSTFFCCGILFGNFNSLALEPLGHIAGIATAVITSVQTLLSAWVGGQIAQYYQSSVVPLVAGFAVLGVAALAAMIWAEAGPKRQAQTSVA
jgi:DHA1 family bicyclomycin/chloramphenicol resistance-like MFS transporter